jgi:phosphoribosylglycinamide formyltransferase 1
VTALRTAILASGSGSNLEVLVRSRTEVAAEQGGDAAWVPHRVITDRPGCGAIERAERLGIPVSVVTPGQDSPPLDQFLAEEGIELILLAGYLRLIPEAVVRLWEGRILNLHPSLLPAFGGKGMYGRRVHEAVLSSGARVTGVTVHLVNEHFDEGMVLAQWPVPVLPTDTPDSLVARIQGVEHALYPRVVESVARALARGGAPEPIPCSDPRLSALRFP